MKQKPTTIKEQKFLQLAGFTILRFTDEEVLNTLSQVEEKILKWIGKKRSRVPDLITTIGHSSISLNDLRLSLKRACDLAFFLLQTLRV